MIYFYKCGYCLSVFASSDINWQATPKCGICQHNLEFMGKAEFDSTKMATEKLVCKCDSRCTHARGPKCICECHAKNHGVGILGYTKITIMENIPVLTISDQDVLMKHIGIRDELNSKLREFREKNIEGIYRQEIDNILVIKIHKRRMRELNSLLNRNQS